MTTMFCPKHRIAACIALFLLLLAGCATNPVTGKRELRLVSEAQEMRMGRQHYLASQQMQGGAYNVDPELTRYVREVGAKLARVSDRGLAYEFVVLNNSTPNAWALPGGKIAVNRGLLVELDNEAELAAVLGHEIVHAAARHGAKNVERGMLLQGAVAVADMAAQDSDYAALIVGGAGLAAGLLAQTYSRKAEREADFYGIQYMARAGYDPQAAVSLQEVFVQLSADRSEPWLSGLFASHPPSAERVENNRLTAAALPPQGELHRERYQQKTAHLKRTQAAYEAYDEGRQALSKGRIQEALGLAREALQTEPREAQFHALLGDVRFTQKRYREALPHYDQAITHHEAFFSFPGTARPHSSAARQSRCSPCRLRAQHGSAGYGHGGECLGRYSAGVGQSGAGAAILPGSCGFRLLGRPPSRDIACSSGFASPSRRLSRSSSGTRSAGLCDYRGNQSDAGYRSGGWSPGLFSRRRRGQRGAHNSRGLSYPASLTNWRRRVGGSDW